MSNWCINFLNVGIRGLGLMRCLNVQNKEIYASADRLVGSHAILDFLKQKKVATED